jgi:hypothetical protein
VPIGLWKEVFLFLVGREDFLEEAGTEERIWREGSRGQKRDIFGEKSPSIHWLVVAGIKLSEGYRKCLGDLDGEEDGGAKGKGSLWGRLCHAGGRRLI